MLALKIDRARFVACWPRGLKEERAIARNTALEDREKSPGGTADSSPRCSEARAEPGVANDMKRSPGGTVRHGTFRHVINPYIPPLSYCLQHQKPRTTFRLRGANSPSRVSWRDRSRLARRCQPSWRRRGPCAPRRRFETNPPALRCHERTQGKFILVGEDRTRNQTVSVAGGIRCIYLWRAGLGPSR